MAKELKTVIVVSNGKKIMIPAPSKIIVAIRARNLKQHQASIDINLDNINRLKFMTETPIEEIERLKKTVRRGP